MIVLYLLAAHLVGDYLLQTRWQAVGKFSDPALRVRHVVSYCIPFAVLLLYVNPGRWHTLAFLSLLGVLHYVTDSRRYTVTPGEWFVARASAETLPPNPWTSLPLLIDQTLHVCQIAVLAGLFLT